MSFRLLSHRLYHHGRHIAHTFCTRRNIHLNIFDHKKSRVVRNIGAAAKDGHSLLNQSTVQRLQSNSLLRFGQHARRLFVDNILNRVTPLYSQELRNETTKKFLFGDSAPLFALIGICLASGSGIITKDDELEGVCWEIREAVARLHDTSSFGRANIKSTSDMGLDDLNIGAPIAKGCSAIVYEAAFKDARQPTDSLNTSAIDSDDSSSASIDHLSPLHTTARYVHNFGTSLENPHFFTAARTSSQSQTQPASQSTRTTETARKRVRFDSQSNVQHTSTLNSTLANSSESISMLSLEDDESHKDDQKYPLALKMMFNYDVQSNAMSILRAMYKETIPAINKYCNDDASGWEKILMEQSVQLPPHPNIVLMIGAFCAQIPQLRESNTLIPMALPQRINPNGYGRNMSLFMLMKRYEYTLREYLREHELPMRAKLILFAQLLEGVAHLYRHGVAHRDLKSDNILIDANGEDLYPILVLSDFGCCCADRSNGLTIPYTSIDIEKGGNAALMAPEIYNKLPGTFAVLDYSKSDLWAAGTLAYEIFGSSNPFYAPPNDEAEQAILVNATYNDADLPRLNDDVPTLVQLLVTNILQKNPNRRLAPDVAANVMQLFLWAPSSWLNSKSMASSAEILQWLLSLTTKVLYEARLGNRAHDPTDTFGLRQMHTNRTQTEYLLISSFLVRSQLQQVRSAIEWIHQANDEFVELF